jgi:NitT/TauT family transport system ATP-binding protein
MLEVNIAEKRFVTGEGEPLVAIRELNFTVADKEFVCLMGPSGCGKTTALRILLGLESDFQGSISIPPNLARLGVMFQEPTLLPWRTVEQNIRLAFPKEQRDKDLSGLLARLGLSGMERFYPAELSVGLARRAAMARAFAVEPALLILDEPFVSLDEETAAGLRKLLAETWAQKPATVLMVTHSAREAAELADRIVVLTPRPGKVRGEMRIDTPRGERTPDIAARIVARLARDFPGIV